MHVPDVGFTFCVQRDVLTSQYPPYGEAYVPYPYPPPYAYYPPHPSPSYAPPRPGPQPYPYGGYMPPYHATSLGALRPRSISPESTHSHSSRSGHAGAVPEPDIVKAGGTTAADRPPLATLATAAVRNTTAPITHEPVAAAATVANSDHGEDEEAPLSQLFRIAPSREHAAHNVHIHPFGFIYWTFTLLCVDISWFFFVFINPTLTNLRMCGRHLQMVVPDRKRRSRD